MVNKQLDPENDQFLVETKIFQPLSGRVYVNLLEGKLYSKLLLIHLIHLIHSYSLSSNLKISRLLWQLQMSRPRLKRPWASDLGLFLRQKHVASSISRSHPWKRKVTVWWWEMLMLFFFASCIILPLLHKKSPYEGWWWRWQQRWRWRWRRRRWWWCSTRELLSVKWARGFPRVVWQWRLTYCDIMWYGDTLRHTVTLLECRWMALAVTLWICQEELHKRVRGQRSAVRMVATAVARAKAGLQEEHRPIASLLLYGPPGPCDEMRTG